MLVITTKSPYAVRALSEGIDITHHGAFGEAQARCEETVMRALGSAGYAKALAEGGRYDSPARAIAFALGAATDSKQGIAAASSPLTRREQEVAAMVAKGMTTRQIAAALVLSPRTVDGHIENIMTKLGSSRRTQIAAWWAKNQVPHP